MLKKNIEGGITLSTETKKSMRRIKRPSRWEQVGIEPKIKLVENWTQDRTTVTNGEIALEVGMPIYGYSANGVDEWGLLGVDDDGHLLITTKSCPEKVELRGREGYTNGVEILNNVARKYTNSIYADGNARSINVDDINRITGYNPETAGFGTNKLWQYGNEVTFYWDGSFRPYYSGSNGLTGFLTDLHVSGFYYPIAEGFNCSQKSTTAREGNKEEITKLTATYYHYYKVSSQIALSATACELLFDEESYWLGSQYVNCRDNCVTFGLHRVNLGGVNMDSTYLYISYGYSGRGNCGTRPVITLKSEVTVDSDGNITI